MSSNQIPTSLRHNPTAAERFWDNTELRYLLFTETAVQFPKSTLLSLLTVSKAAFPQIVGAVWGDEVSLQDPREYLIERKCARVSSKG